MTVHPFINLINNPTPDIEKLNNNYESEIIVDNISYKSVSNYIYSNSIKNPEYSKKLKHVSPVNVRNSFLNHYELEINDILNKSVEKGLLVKFENEKMKQLLLETKYRPIVYKNENGHLGSGKDEKGDNLYGKYIEQIRHNIRIEDIEKEKEKKQDDFNDKLYKTYLVSEFLNNKMENGDDIKEYINTPFNTIIEKIDKKKIDITKEDVIRFYENKTISTEIVRAILNPETLVLNIRKQKISDLRNKKLKKRREICFDVYINYIINTYFHNDIHLDKYKETREQITDKLDFTQKNDLENKIFKLYMKDKLPKRVLKKINDLLLTLKIPTESDVQDSENVSIDYKEKIAEKKLESHFKIEGDAVYVYPFEMNDMDAETKKYIQFSPYFFVNMLTIENFIFPTIEHYVVSSLIFLLNSVETFDDAYKYILRTPTSILELKSTSDFIDIDSIYKKYNEMKKKDYNETLQKYAKIGLDTKFQNNLFQDILVSTKHLMLLWNDTNDNYFGVGKDGKGNNFIGKYLSLIREKLSKETKVSPIKDVTIKQIEEFINNDPFIKKWYQIKTRDMCNVIMIMKRYLFTKMNSNLSIDDDFVRIVLLNIYYSCKSIYNLSNDVQVDAPVFFVDLVKKQNGFQFVTYPTINEIWKFVFVLLFSMMDLMKKTEIKNAKVIISKSEKILSNSNKDCKKILSLNENDNCIITSIINILGGISEFNKYYSYSTEIDNRDVICAYSILNGNFINIQDDNEIINVGWNDGGPAEEIQDYHILYNEIIGLIKQYHKINDNSKLQLIVEEILNHLTYVKNNNLISTKSKLNRIHFFSSQKK